MSAARKGRLLLARAVGGGAADVAKGVADQLRHVGFDVVEVVLPTRSVPAVVALKAVVAHRRRLRRASIVHVEVGSLDLAAYWFALLAARFNRRLVLVAHDAPTIAKAPATGLVRGGRRWQDIVGHRVLSPLLDKHLDRSLARSVRVGVVLSEDARAQWRARGPKRIVVTDHGADPPSPDAPPPSRGRHVLCAGFVGPSKGIDVLLAAWRELGATPALPLVIAGTDTGGPNGRRYLDRLRKDAGQLADPPIWLGSISEDALRRAFAEAAIVVVPYRRSNPASGIIVRAMVDGRAIVATRVPAAIDAIRDGEDGVLVEPGDPFALSRALASLLEDPQLRDRLGFAAKQRAEERFTWERHMRGLLDAYGLAGDGE